MTCEECRQWFNDGLPEFLENLFPEEQQRGLNAREHRAACLPCQEFSREQIKLLREIVSLR